MFVVRFLVYMFKPWWAIAGVVSGLAIYGINLTVNEFTDDRGVIAIVLLATLLVLALIAGVRLQREKEDRERVDYTLSSSYSRFDDLPIHDQKYSGINALWICVTNNGRAAEFTARIPELYLPVSRLENGESLNNEPLEVFEVAWEKTTAYKCDIVDRSRLLVGFVSSSPACFFWATAENAVHNPDKHGMGWRLVPEEMHLEFDLEVSHLTSGNTVTRRCFIDFDDAKQFKDFGFLDDTDQG